MKKRFAMTSLRIMVFLFIGGLIMLFSSTAMGQDAGDRAIQANGGSMNTEEYRGIINSTSENFRTAGMVISLVGGFGTLISGFGVYTELNDEE